MAKAKRSKSTASQEPVNTKLPINLPSNRWVEKETSHRIIDLTEDQKIVNDDGTKIDKPKGKRLKAEGAKTKVTKAAYDLAKTEINGLYGGMIDHGRITLKKAIAIGGKLMKVKATLKHGQFGDWIDSALDFDQKTAERYMKLYHGRGKLKFDTVSKITSALRLLDEEKRARRTKPPKPSANVESDAPVLLPKPQQEIIEKPVVVENPILVGIEAGAAKVLAPAFEVVEAHELPILVASGPEEVLAELLDVMKRHDGKCRCQTIRQDGQIKLNEYFTTRLGLRAA